MSRRSHVCLALLTVVSMSGCADNITAVMRDHYNVEHEFLDTMLMVVDDDSAKKFNEIAEKRIQPKEEIIKERKDKIQNNQYTQRDRAELASLIEHLESNPLKTQVASLDARLRQMQQRTRKILVKLALDKGEEMKRSKDQEFTVDANKLWAELSNLRLPVQFGESSVGGMMGGGMAMMPGMPGAAGGAGGAGGAGDNKPAEKKATVDANANKNLRLFVTYRPRGPNQWEPPQVVWKAGNTVVTSLKVGAYDLTPVTP